MAVLLEQDRVVKVLYYKKIMNWISKYIYKLLIVFTIIISSPLIYAQEIDEDFKKMIERKYDEFPTIDPSAAENKVNKKTYFLDTRELNEYKVSHLPNAIHVGYDELDWSAINTIDKDAEIIVYCSIGVRSQDIGKRLNEVGYSNVKNLYGGIFLWADQSRVMEDTKGNSTNKVHGYNKYWGRWIKKAEAVYE